jgi:hypothetical protein
MIMVSITCGLGNQLFQYSLGRRLSLDRGVPLKLELSWYENKKGYRPRWPYRLSLYSIVAEPADRNDVDQITGKGHNKSSALFYKFLQRCMPYYRRHYIREQFQGFDQNILKVPNDAYLDGFWQSDKYFLPIAEIIRNDLSLKDPPDPHNADFAALMSSCNSISLHIRRGDRATIPEETAIHGLCSLEYYQTAINYIIELIENPRLFVFSDDIPWVKEYLMTIIPTTYIDHNGVDKNYMDLWLMSQCNHHIIANSSFSWWGAWIRDNPGKIVVTPKRFFNIDMKFVNPVPDNWIQL